MPSPLLPYALACAGTYEASAIPQWQDELKTVHVYLSMIDGVHCIAWEGTTDWEEWFIDVMAAEVPMFGHLRLGPIALNWARDVLTVIDQIDAYLKSLNYPPYDNTGHSKGAAECLLFHGFMKDRGHAPRHTFAFEAPRVGTSILRDFMAADLIDQTVTVNTHGKDIVTQVPWGPTYVDMRDPLMLFVPPTYDIATKHKIPAVIQALQAMA